MPNGDASDKGSETRAPERTEAAEERARTEALEDRGLLSEREKQYRADIRDGKQRSGITGEFGSLMLGDAQGTKQPHQVERNDAGQVTSVTTPDGQRHRFEYGSDGKVNRVTYDDGSSWRRDGDRWYLHNPDGQRSGEPLKGSIDVDRDGNYIFRGNDGVTEIQRPDGTYRREYPNGAYFERNADNKVTEVHFANGTSQRYEYGPDGRLQQYTDQNGWSWRKENGTWNLYDNNGQRTGEPLQGDIDVDSHGNFIFRHNDGMVETTSPDGSYVRQAADGHVSRVTYPDGTAKEFQYGPDGRLTEYTDQNGWSWRRDSSGWHLYNAEGQRTAETLQGDIEVDRNGNFTFVHTDGTRETTRPNGTTFRTPPGR
jgi:YD repeat-containing protein